MKKLTFDGHSTIMMDRSGLFMLCPKTRKLDRIKLTAIKCPQCKVILPKQLLVDRS